jgi:hypothetical protein
MTAHMSALQEQVDQLYANLNALKAHVDTISIGSMGTPFNGQKYARPMSMPTPMLPPSPSQQRRQSLSKHPRFHGPTSSAFNLGVAKSSLQTMGITGPEEGEDEGAMTQDPTPMGTPPIAPALLAMSKPPLHAEKDPIWSMSKQEALRLISVWQEEMGIMYPFLNIDGIARYAEMLFTFVEAATRSGLMQGALPGADSIMDDRTNTLKLILAAALILEGNGKDALGEKLFENVHNHVQTTLLGPVDLQSICLLILTVRTAEIKTNQANQGGRACTSSTVTTRLSHGVSLAWPPGNAWKWASIEGRLTTSSRMPRNATLPFGLSGQCIYSIGGGVLEQACHLLCKMLTLIPTPPSL